MACVYVCVLVCMLFTVVPRGPPCPPRQVLPCRGVFWGSWLTCASPDRTSHTVLDELCEWWAIQLNKHQGRHCDQVQTASQGAHYDVH